MKTNAEYIDHEREVLARARADLAAAERRIATALWNINYLKRWDYLEAKEASK